MYNLIDTFYMMLFGTNSAPLCLSILADQNKFLEQNIQPLLQMFTINSLHAGYMFLFMLLLSSADIYQKILYKKSFGNTVRVSNGLDPDQARRIVGPDLGPSCLQKFSADDKSRRCI